MLESKKGFTLMDVLLVIAIIGILATIVLISLSSGREAARDAKEIYQLEEMETVIDTYFYEHNELPYQVPGFDPEAPVCHFRADICVDCSVSDPEDFFTQLREEGYLTEDTVLSMFGTSQGDPSLKICYHYTIDLKRYKMVAKLNSKKKMANDGGISDDYYEVGNDLTMPILESSTYYE